MKVLMGRKRTGTEKVIQVKQTKQRNQQEKQKVILGRKYKHCTLLALNIIINECWLNKK